jgi:hypothetical protein
MRSLQGNKKARNEPRFEGKGLDEYRRALD